MASLTKCDNMATLRKWLDDKGFDWGTAQIIIQELQEDEDLCRWEQARVPRRILIASDPALDKVFDTGFGAPECPEFIAKDKDAIYFPSQYDGSTSIEKVFIDIEKYMDASVPTIMPGG